LYDIQPYDSLSIRGNHAGIETEKHDPKREVEYQLSIPVEERLVMWLEWNLEMLKFIESRKNEKRKNYKTIKPSLDDLIKMNIAAGRPQDKEDLRYLREIKRQLKKKGRKKL